MKQQYWVLAAWLVSLFILVALTGYFVIQLIQNIQQGMFQHWEEEACRFIAMSLLISLISGGFYQELRHVREA